MVIEEQSISPPDPSMFDESVNNDYNVPSHVEEDSIVDGVPSENSASELDSDVWEVIEKGSQMGRQKLVNNSGYSYVVNRVRNGTKYWRCSVRNSNMKCPATVTERCGVFESSQASHYHSPVVGASVLTKLKVAFKEKAQSGPFTASPRIVDEAIYNHVDPIDVCDLPYLRSLYRTANRVCHAMRHNHQENLKFDLNLDTLPADFVQAYISVRGKNAPIATKIVCFSRLLKCLRSLYGKQCGPRSDCSFRSSLFWVYAVCFDT